MDELTRERYPHPIPYDEAWTRPQSRSGPEVSVVSGRRVVLCGTASLEVQEAGGDRREVRHRRLLEVIRRWKA